MSRYAFLIFIFLGFSCPCFGSELNLSDSDYYSKSQSTYGGIGLIQNPTARFSDDGEFTFGISTESPYNRLYAKVQFFPWMEAVLRYTEGEHVPYHAGNKRGQTWKDKGADIKFRLFEEGDILPELAVGINDLGGTGAYGSEYIVASKRFNNLDLTLGLGWGRLGGVDSIDNPFGWFSDDFLVRGRFSGLGGTISSGRMFTGKFASVFGGLEYYTPIPNLSVKLEYDPSDYSDAIGISRSFDQIGDIFEVDSRFNIGLNYQLDISQREKIDFSLGYVRGNT